MNIDEWIYDRLNTDIADLEGRITPEIGDALTEKPYIIYRLVGEEPTTTQNAQNVGTRHWMYDICCVDSTDSGARSLAMQARDALLDHNGDGVQSVVLKGSRKGTDLDSRDHEFSFEVEIWENLS